MKLKRTLRMSMAEADAMALLKEPSLITKGYTRVTYGSTSFVAVDRSGDGQVIITASDSSAGTVAVKLDKVQAKAIADLILKACR